MSQFDSVALLGPRQVGKTTLAREIAAESSGTAIYLDLERKTDRDILANADGFFAEHSRQLIILDEIQRAPKIFEALRGQIDSRRELGEEGGKFLLLGSASMELLRQSSESLAGRISFVELTPIMLSEANDWHLKSQFSTLSVQAEQSLDNYDTQSEFANNGNIDLGSLWLRGGFPKSYIRSDDHTSIQWRYDFIQTYLERDVPNFGLKVATERLEMFWRMLAADQGELFNAQRYCQNLGVSGHTISRYLDVLEKLLLVRQLRPWSTNTGKRLVKSSRPYVRDSGLLHALLDLKTIDDLSKHRIMGKSWEGFVIEALISVAGERVRPYFYRTGAGAEVDLVLEYAPNRCWAIEIKHSTSPTVDRGFYHAADDLKAERRIIVHRGPESFLMKDGVEAMPLFEAIAAVRAEASERY